MKTSIVQILLNVVADIFLYSRIYVRWKKNRDNGCFVFFFCFFFGEEKRKEIEEKKKQTFR